MDKEKAILLIQKVLSKAENNSSEEEAHAAMLKAQELLIKYELTMDEIVTTSHEDKKVLEENIRDYGRVNWYEKKLASIISENFKCKSFTRRKDSKDTIIFIGLENDVDIAKRVYSFAIETLKYFTKQYINNLVDSFNKKYPDVRFLKSSKDFKEEKNSYIIGYLSGLKSKFKEQVDRNNWGLILVKDKAVTQYIDNLKLGKGSSSNIKLSSNNDHYNSGFKDGNKFEYKTNLLKK